MSETYSAADTFSSEIKRVYDSNAEHYPYVLPTRDNVVKFETRADMRRRVSGSGSLFFSRDTMRFFGSRVESLVGNGRVLITSEQPPYEVRMYSVRYFYTRPGSDMIEHETFASWIPTLEDARVIAQLLAGWIADHH